MIFLRDPFFLYNFFKNCLILAIGIGLFLGIFDFIFAEEIAWKYNILQSIFLSIVLLGLNVFANFRRLKIYSKELGQPQLWKRLFKIEGTAELSIDQVYLFLIQDKYVDKVIKTPHDKVSFIIHQNKFLPPLIASIQVEKDVIGIEFVNHSFLHFGASTSINLYSFLDRMEVFFTSDKAF